MPAGRPPTPNEIKRRRGTARPDRTPAVSSVVALPQAPGVPEPPAEFGLAATQLWNRAWAAGITWISPLSDMDAVESACRLADDLEIARRRYHATTDPADGRMVATFEAGLASALARLGFDPTARTRLGVAEVRKQSAFEKLLADRAQR